MNIKTYLKGVGQIMLQNSWVTGAFFLLGIFVSSWSMGIGAVVGVIVGTLSAVLFKYNKEEIHNGLYGFNGALVGIALVFFFGFSITTLILGAVFAILSTYIMHFMMKKSWKPYTFPFILTTWIAVLLINKLSILSFVSQAGALAKLNIFSAITEGFGQVMFQGSIIAGILFFIGIFLLSRKSALFALFGSVLGMLFALGLGMPLDAISIGLFGYNAVLCAIVFAGDGKKAIVSVYVATALSVIILDGFMSFGLIALTAPFVFSTWITEFIRNKFAPK